MRGKRQHGKRPAEKEKEKPDRLEMARKQYEVTDKTNGESFFSPHWRFFFFLRG